MTDRFPSSDKKLSELEHVRGVLRPRLERAERIYARGIASLWIGNAGGSIASLGFVGAVWNSDKYVPIQPYLLVPLWFFVLGMISMGIGTAFGLYKERQALRSIEEAQSVLDMPAGITRRPSEEIGLDMKNTQTIGAGFSSAFFCLGCLSGLIALTFSN